MRVLMLFLACALIVAGSLAGMKMYLWGFNTWWRSQEVTFTAMAVGPMIMMAGLVGGGYCICRAARKE